LGGRRDEPLPPTHLAGALTWRHTTSGGIWLSGQDLVITSTDLRGGGDFALHLPPGEAPADLDLRASIQSADAARIHAYLPRELMPPRLVSWLSKAIVAGQITGGDLRVRGHPVDLPFQGDEGRFELRLDFADAILDYRPGWPALRELAGQLRIRDQSLDIVAERGRIFDSSLTRVEASLPRLRGPAPLHIQGTAEGPFADTLRALAETPLATRLGRLAESLVVSGDSHLELEMDLPLRQAAPLALSGRVSWPRAATLAIPGTPIELSELAGTLTFTRDRLATEDLRGLLWGQPADLQIATRGADGSLDTAALLISARSRTSTQQLAEHFPHPLWAALSGALDWTLDLELPGHALHTATPTLAYRLSSQLRGLASALPAPLGKTAATSTELDLAGTLTPGSAMRLTGRLGTVGAAVRIALDVPSADPRAWQGHLRLGSDTAPSPRGVGIHLDGQMPELDLPAWLTTLHTYWPEVLAPGQPPGRPWLNGADIRVDRLSIGQARLSSAHLKMTPHETPGRGGWNLEVNAEQGAGQIALNPDDEVPLDVVLRRLSLRDLRVTPASRETASLDALGRVPAARVRVDDLRWGETRLGTLELTLRPDSGGLEIPSIRLSGDGLVDAHGKAHWRRSAHDSHSELSMHIDSDDPGRLLAALGGRAHIELESMQARMILDWPGGFGAFAPRRATGLIEIDLGAGRLLALEPGIGRLLGILNLDAARRRLAMDFTDLYGDGFAFEAVRGRIRLDQGRADLRDVTIDGPSSRLLVDGSSDLINERLDQIVIVEPKLGSSVALASAVAGGPIVGAAVYLVDRLAGNPLDRLGRSRYRVTGPWSAPEVIRIGWEPALAPTLTTGHDGANPPTGDANLFLD
ncbi:MAG: hypothetical protein EOM91_13200, partial [Sphingobacteriia bacterium]|nr:hypothetical protein [Sphingobacteriia bacterium]